MTHEHISSSEQPRNDIARFVNPADYRPTPEQWDDLPDATFDLERMETGHIVSLVAGLDNLLDSTRGVNTLPQDDWRNIGMLTCLMMRDLACLPARDLKKAKEVISALAAHPDPYARGTAADVMDSLFRFQLDDYNERQQVIDLWLRLLRDEDENVREGASSSISQTVYGDWIDESMARYLDSKLPAESQRDDW